MFRRISPRLASSFASLRSAGPIPLEPLPTRASSGAPVCDLHDLALNSATSGRLFGGSPAAALLSTTGVSLFCVCFGVNILNAVVEAAYREEEEDDDDDNDE